MDSIGNPPHGGGGHPHSGGGGGHPQAHPQFGGGRHISTRGDYWPLYAVQPLSGCVSWGGPVAMTPDLVTIGQRVLAASGGQPTSADYSGVSYLFSWDNGMIMSARPCTARS